MHKIHPIHIVNTHLNVSHLHSFLLYDTERVWNQLKDNIFTKTWLDDWVGWIMIITFVQSPPRTEVHYNDGAKIFLSICQSKLVSNWQESSGLKEILPKILKILPEWKYCLMANIFRNIAEGKNCQETKYFQKVNTVLTVEMKFERIQNIAF